MSVAGPVPPSPDDAASFARARLGVEADASSRFVGVEGSRLSGRATLRGVPYDAGALAVIYWRRLPEAALGAGVMNLVVTDRLMTTQGEDGRPHARVNLMAEPYVLSTSGLVEGPARPRGYYIARRATAGTGLEALAEADAKVEHAGSFLEYDDPRMSRVAIGPALQCVFHFATGEPFCDEAGCMLYNAHWQEELLAAQLGDRLCERHAKALEEMSCR